MKIRYQADADVNEDIISGVRRRAPEIDIRTATESSLSGIADMEVLAIAASENRILITHDRKTMPRHFAEFIGNNNFCPGVLVVSQNVPVSRVIDDLIIIWYAGEAEEYIDRIQTLPL